MDNVSTIIKVHIRIFYLHLIFNVRVIPEIGNCFHVRTYKEWLLFSSETHGNTDSLDANKKPKHLVFNKNFPCPYC